jgi:hypothetical protein
MRLRKGISGIPAVFLLAACLVATPVAGAQEAANAQKIYADVAGTYEFPYEGQVIVVIFLVHDGRLYGTEGSGGEEAEVKPVDLEKLKFEATVQSTGQYYEIAFTRDEGGKVSKCQMITSGIVIDGTRVK